MASRIPPHIRNLRGPSRCTAPLGSSFSASSCRPLPPRARRWQHCPGSACSCPGPPLLRLIGRSDRSRKYLPIREGERRGDERQHENNSDTEGEYSGEHHQPNQYGQCNNAENIRPSPACTELERLDRANVVLHHQRDREYERDRPRHRLGPHQGHDTGRAGHALRLPPRPQDPPRLHLRPPPPHRQTPTHPTPQPPPTSKDWPCTPARFGQTDPGAAVAQPMRAIVPQAGGLPGPNLRMPGRHRR